MRGVVFGLASSLLVFSHVTTPIIAAEFGQSSVICQDMIFDDNVPFTGQRGVSEEWSRTGFTDDASMGEGQEDLVEYDSTEEETIVGDEHIPKGQNQ